MMKSMKGTCEPIYLSMKSRIGLFVYFSDVARWRQACMQAQIKQRTHSEQRQFGRCIVFLCYYSTYTYTYISTSE